MVLRGHHLLCTGLFVGAGYSDGFSENMSRIIGQLQENPSIQLVCRRDTICTACPKSVVQEGTQDFCDQNSIRSMDRIILEALHIEENRCDTYDNIMKLVRERMTGEIFQKCCGSCSWYKKGFCSYETYRERIMKKEAD